MPPAICQNSAGGVACRRGGGGLAGGGVWAVQGGGGVAMVCHWAVQGEQNKDQGHNTPFKESRTRTKHVVPLQLSMQKNFGAIGTMDPAPLSLKT